MKANEASESFGTVLIDSRWLGPLPRISFKRFSYKRMRWNQEEHNRQESMKLFALVANDSGG